MRKQMDYILCKTKSELGKLIRASLAKALSSKNAEEYKDLDFNIEVPSDKINGDLSTNVAMIATNLFKLAPVKVAHIIVDNIETKGTVFKEVRVAGPGFINFYFDKIFYAKVIQEINDLREDYGKSDYGKGLNINLEFVSANPTGPMHIGNARGGALGDCLASIMEATGFKVCREFYINDAGNQIQNFGLSLDLRYQQIFKGEEVVPLTDECYKGEDILELAKEYANCKGDKLLQETEEKRREELINFALPLNISRMQNELEKYKIKYDIWFKESELYNSGEIDKVIEKLTEKKLTYEKDGALWYKASDFGAEKDEVLIRKNKTKTYFASDIAYHVNKLSKRSFDKCIDIWGADHHGHIARLKSAVKALGYDSEKIEVILMQLVRVIKDNNPVKMSKRSGKAIGLSELLDSVPVDSVRFLFNMKDSGSKIDFDLDLAVKQDSVNPVYYVQYANARIQSIKRAIVDKDVINSICSVEELTLLNSSEEIALIKHLSVYPEELILATKTYNPTRITKYVIDLANLFHKFYSVHRVRSDNKALMRARLALCDCVSIVIQNVLHMFKIEAPEVM